MPNLVRKKLTRWKKAGTGTTAMVVGLALGMAMITAAGVVGVMLYHSINNDAGSMTSSQTQMFGGSTTQTSQSGN